MISKQDKAFIDMCVFIATYHPANKQIDYDNDICIKSGINSFRSSVEYRDKYVNISISTTDSAVFVEYIQPIEKIILLIDGVGSIITLDSDYQYLINHIVSLYSGVLKMIKRLEQENT